LEAANFSFSKTTRSVKSNGFAGFIEQRQSFEGVGFLLWHLAIAAPVFDDAIIGNPNYLAELS
jgi:hypothetical protein